MDLRFDDAFFASFAFKLHISAAIDVVVNGFAMLLILKCSGRMMGKYKWFLLNVTVWSAAYDFHMNFLLVPAPLFPAPGICTLGVLRHLGPMYGTMIELVVLGALLSCTAMSILFALIYRWLAVHGRSDRLTGTTGIAVMAAAHIFYWLPALAMQRWTFGTDLAEQATEVVQRYPSLGDVLRRQTCVAIPIWSKRRIFAFGAVIFVLVAVVVAAALFFVYRIFVLLNDRRSHMSTRTYNMHRQLTVALLLQFAIPFVTLGVPFVMELVVGTLQLNAPDLTVLAMQICGCHSVLNTAFMIAAVGPYRAAVVSFFRRGRCKGTPTATSIAMSSAPKVDSNVLRAVNRRLKLHSNMSRRMPTSVS